MAEYSEHINAVEAGDSISASTINTIIQQLSDRVQWLDDNKADNSMIEGLQDRVTASQNTITNTLTPKTSNLSSAGAASNALNIIIETAAAMGDKGAKGTSVGTTTYNLSEAKTIYVLGCSASCSSNCVTACTNGCGGACTSCTGQCTSCSGGCSNTCTGCDGNCVNTCKSSCIGSCSGVK